MRGCELSGAGINNIHRLAAVVVDDLVDLVGVNGLAVDADNDVAGLQAGLGGRRIGQRAPDLNIGLLAPARESRAGFWIEHRSHRNQLALAVPQNPNAERMSGAGDFLHVDVFPSRIGGVADLDDAVAFLQAGLRGGAIGHDVSDFRGRRTWEFWGSGP